MPLTLTKQVLLTKLPDPVIVEHDGILVVRDDLIEGGTKRRVLEELLPDTTEFVYASPAYGYAQVALGYACRNRGRSATVFTAKRKEPHARTSEAAESGARIIMVPHGYLNVVQAAAKRYAEQRGATLLPFGLDTPEFRERLTAIARGLKIAPKEVWTVAGSGMLSRSLQAAWPKARFYAIGVGRTPLTGGAALQMAPERFEQYAKEPPPFPSCSNYDAKAWRFVRDRAGRGALFWNVAK